MAEGQVVERKLAAIFAADVADYSRLMGLDEIGTLRRLQAYRVILDRLIAAYRGRIFNTAGDSVLAEFDSAVEAVRCAITIQDELRVRNAQIAEERRMEFRIGRMLVKNKLSHGFEDIGPQSLKNTHWRFELSGAGGAKLGECVPLRLSG